MDKVVHIYQSHQAADEADLAFYRSLTPQQRLDMVGELMARHYDLSKGLERVITVSSFTER